MIRTSLYNTYKNLVTKEGPLAFYKGMGSPMATIPIVNGARSKTIRYFKVLNTRDT